MDEKYGSEWGGWCSRERCGSMEYVFGSVSEVVVGIFLDSLGTRLVVVFNICFWHDWWWYREGFLRRHLQSCTDLHNLRRLQFSCSRLYTLE